MAEKTKARQKPKARSRGSTSKARKPSTAKARKASGSTSRSGNAKTSNAKTSSNGSGRVETALHAVEGTAKDAGHTLGNAASKAKVPLLAGGAALAGAAGGLALGARHSRRHGLRSIAPRRPQVKVKSQDLAKAAKEVGSFGAQMGRLASELQQSREATGNSKHRSPVEVVLEGLTSRRSG
ncbi:MAG TPA: hypothetical protein VN752_02245 [Solirubrobacterales bacterium]|nr:hypothetical protein [Solirubrobacterales bacterium]